MTVLVSDIVQRALEHISVKQSGQAVDADDADLCLRALTSLLDALQLEPQAVLGLQELTYTPTMGQQSVSIGPTGNIVATAPVSLEPSSFYRTTATNIDTPIAFANTFDEYAKQPSKSTTGLPRVCYYMRNDVATGTLYLWPAADGTFVLHLWARQDILNGYTTLAQTTALTLPNGYRYYLEYAIAAEVAASFGLAGGVEHQAAVRGATNAMRRIKSANTVVHQLQSPVVSRGLPYNIFTE